MTHPLITALLDAAEAREDARAVQVFAMHDHGTVELAAAGQRLVDAREAFRSAVVAIEERLQGIERPESMNGVSVRLGRWYGSNRVDTSVGFVPAREE